jgi:hypothetical protein
VCVCGLCNCNFLRTTLSSSSLLCNVPWRDESIVVHGDCVPVNMLYKCNKSAAANGALIAV